jgi:hypothetical protein
MNPFELVVCYNCCVIGFAMYHKGHNKDYANTAGGFDANSSSQR